MVVVVVSVEHALAIPDESFPASTALPTGGWLYAALVNLASHVILVHLQPREDHVKHWLEVHGILRYSGIFGPVPGVEPEYQRVEQMRQISVEWGRPILWLEGDPHEGARLLSEGIPTILLSEPSYPRGEFRADHDRLLRPWSAIEDEVAKQAHLYAEDERRLTEDTGRFE